MPVVEVTMFEGRSEETKARIAREIADAVSDGTGNAIDAVHVIFREVGRDSWARGLSLGSRREPVKADSGLVRADHASVSRIQFDPATERDYLALRRDVINPGMATQRGFVSSLLLRMKDRANEYLLVNKWTDPQASADYTASKLHDSLKDQALSILPRPLETEPADVVHLDPE